MKKRGFILTVAIVAIFVAGVLGAKFWLRSRVGDAIERSLAGTGAKVGFGRVSVSLAHRSVTVKDVRVRVQNNDVSHRGFTVVSLDATLPSVAVLGIRYGREGGGPALSVGRLVVRMPGVMLVTKGGTDGIPGVDSLPSRKFFRETIREKLSRLSIGEISVTGTTLEYVHWRGDGEAVRATLGGGNLTVNDFRPASPPGSVRPLFSDNVHLVADSVVYDFARGTQKLRADSLEIETAARTLTAGRFSVVPRFDKHEFAQKSAGHEDWTAITLGVVVCRGVDFIRLFDEKTIDIDTVSLSRVEIDSYKNRKVFHRPRAKQMLYQAVQRLPLPLDIQAVNFENFRLGYEELPEGGTAPGIVTLSGGRGTGTNVTNIREGHDRFMTVDFKAMFMHSGALEARFLFPVAADDDHWEATGRLGPADMAAFNRVLEPLANIRVNSGHIGRVDFRISGSLERSHSHLVMEYRDLRVVLLDKHDHSRERKFLTFLADGVLIRPDNPGRDGNGRLREGEGSYMRNPERSMWHYIWHSLLAAILKTVI